MKASAGTPFLQCGSATLLYYAAEAALKFADAHFVLLLLHNKGTYIAAVPYCLYGCDLGGIPFLNPSETKIKPNYLYNTLIYS